MLVDGQFQALVQVPGDPFEDWFTWGDEGKDWRRPEAANKAKAAKAAREPKAAKARKRGFSRARRLADDSASGDDSSDDSGRCACAPRAHV